jgi:N-acetylglucosamine kinase-like BadF-type ATPase
MTDGLLLGVDGGNTKTIALLARADGSIVGAGRVLGCADLYAVPPEAAFARIWQAVDDALAGAGGGPVRAAAFSMAGADWPEDHALLREAFAQRFPEPVVVNDALGALRAAIPHGSGVVVVAGTGAATGARGPDGQTWHSSFWQEPQGAHELAVQALHAVYRAELGIDPPTALTEAVLTAAGAPDVAALRHRQTRREDRWAAIDALAPVLLDVAASGDPAALRAVRDQGASLGRTAVAAARQVGIGDEPFELALAGGLFRHPAPELADAVIEAVRKQLPAVVVVRPELEPAAGALLLSFDAAGIVVDDGTEARLRASMPDARLFDTRRSGRPNG